MNSDQSSLLGFLKKKSLFSNSPTKNYSRKRSRSKSRDSKNFENRSYTRQNNLQELEENISLSPRLLHKVSEKNLPRYEESYHKVYSPTNNGNIRYKPNTERIFQRYEDNQGRRNFRNPEESGIFGQKGKDQTGGPFGNSGNYWGGLVSHSTSFQSARIESAHCLETLAVRLGTEVSSINYKIESFNSRMAKILSHELKTLKEKILAMVQETFKEAEKGIKEYMRVQEAKLAGQLIQMRESLQKEYAKVESMREEIGKTNWRKVAGEILSTDLEYRADQMIKKSSNSQVGHWQLEDLSGLRLSKFQVELKETVRLKT